MRVIYAMLVLLLLAAACKKDKFTTKPQLKITDVNKTELSRNEDLRFKILLTDKEGDFTTFFGYSKNVLSCPAGSFADSNKLHIPQEFIDAHLNEGDIVIDLADVTLKGDNKCNSPGGGSVPKTDTAIFSFWTKDRAGNTSDTIHSGPIIIHAN